MSTLTLFRRITLILAVVMLTLVGTLATPQTTKASGLFCFLNGSTFSGSGIPVPPPDSYQWNGVSGTTAHSPSYTLPNGQTAIDYFTIYYDGVSYSYDAVTSVTDCTETFHDGRINRRDAGQTVAVYCEGGEKGGIFTRVPASPVWKLGLVATAAEINAVSKNPTVNTLIKRSGNVRLYRLVGGALQINAPGLDPAKGDYVFTFNECGF